MKSCPNAEDPKDQCLCSICDPCFAKRVAIEELASNVNQDKNSLRRSTRLRIGASNPTKHDEESGQMLKKAQTSNKHICCHERTVSFCETNLSHIMGKWVDGKRQDCLHLPTHCFNCKHMFGC